MVGMRKGEGSAPGGQLLLQRLVAVPQQAAEAGLKLGHAAGRVLAQPPQQRRPRQAPRAGLMRHPMHLRQQHLHRSWASVCQTQLCDGQTIYRDSMTCKISVTDMQNLFCYI